MAILIALVIAVLCSSLITAAYIYRHHYQVKFRTDRLYYNLYSGINILLSSPVGYSNETKRTLFDDSPDSVSLHRFEWGIFDIGIVRTFDQLDTVTRTFSIGYLPDSATWAVLYVADNDRPLSVSGKTLIRGNAWLPKAGTREAYVDNQGYEGDKKIISGGRRHDSQKQLPGPAQERLALLEKYFQGAFPNDSLFFQGDSIVNSFRMPVRYLNCGKVPKTLSHVFLKGHLVILSDTTLTIDSTARLDHILIAAQTIIVKDGFRGSCQLFATDSIHIGRGSRLEYPSCAGIVSGARPTAAQPKVFIGEKVSMNGAVFICKKNKDTLLPLITLAKGSVISGQLYTTGIIQYQESPVINGSTYTGRFVYQKNGTIYENYLISSTADARALSPYYLGGMLLPGISKKPKILEWLERK
jgi:hypothetical protein